MSNDPYKHQISGNHYLDMGMQPIHFAMVNKWDAGAFSVLKYLSRHRAKNGLEDVKKARHFVDLRMAERDHLLRGIGKIPMIQYVKANEIVGIDASTLVLLGDWVRFTEPKTLEALIKNLDLISAEYGHEPLL